MKKFNLSTVELSHYDKKFVNLKLPNKPSEKLAEFLGILTGDGYMNKYGKYRRMIEIAGDSILDKNYLSVYVKNMIENLFNLTPYIIYKKDQNSMYLRITSKGLFNYLEKIGFKKGKKEQIGVPNWILKNDNYCKSFIQGLADTDFSLALLNRNQKKYKYYPKVCINSKSKIIIKFLNEWLTSKNIENFAGYDYLKKDTRGFNDTIIHALHINGRKRLEKWMNLISFRNERHLNKYKKYKFGTAGI